MFNTEIKYTTL